VARAGRHSDHCFDHYSVGDPDFDSGLRAALHSGRRVHQDGRNFSLRRDSNFVPDDQVLAFGCESVVTVSSWAWRSIDYRTIRLTIANATNRN
jgi:hypothetical protein